ncbi:MAG: cysteine desulfurase family protein [Planctomycetota bacterium]|jgi:cysteine desulfurase
MPSRIYLDHNASTPTAPDVVRAMVPFLEEHFGNPSSGHWASTEARRALERARAQVANCLGSRSEEIVFTSGGSESNNHALKGAYFASREKGNHIVVSAVEHPAVFHPCRFLESLGAEVSIVPVDRTGLVDPDDVLRACNDRTILVSVMHANNEVGTVQPIEAISSIARERGILFHTDAAQSVGKIPVRVDGLGVDLLSVAGHKVYAPKGIGALYIRRGTALEPWLHGAPHEEGRRAGTESALLAVGLGRACELVAADCGVEKIQALRDAFHVGLKSIFGEGLVLNGHPEKRLPNTLNVAFPGRRGADVLASLPGVAATTGAACHADSVKLSPVLKSMGVDPEIGKGAVRFSLGRGTTRGEIEAVLERLHASARE